MEKKVKVHFGCGHQRLDGWINVDLERSCRPDVVADLRQDLPFRPQSIDYIHSEDFIEHLNLGEGIHFLEESHRVLKESGVMRLLTPDLREFAKRYLERGGRLVKQYEEMIAPLGLPSLKTRKGAEVFNAGMRLGGHTFLYDEEILTDILESLRFIPRRVSFGRSEEAELRGLDIRSPETGISLYFDCYKDKRIEKSGSRFEFLHPIRSFRRLLKG